MKIRETLINSFLNITTYESITNNVMDSRLRTLKIITKQIPENKMLIYLSCKLKIS